MRTVAAMVIGLTLAGTGAEVRAQSSTQWRTKPAESRFQATASIDAARELHGYARCLVNRRYDRARSVVLAAYSSQEQAAAIKKIVVRNEDPCLDIGYSETRMRFSNEVLVGALGQALVLKDYPDLPAVVRSYTVVPEQENARLADLDPAEMFGRCVVQRDPAGALALFSSARGTDEEQRAFATLLDDLSPCLAAGSTSKMNKLFVRNTLGAAAYRLAHQIQPRGQARSAQPVQSR